MGEKFNIPASFQVMSEMGEASSAMLDAKIAAILNKYSEYIDYIHFSDQFSGVKPQEDTNSSTPNKLPDVDKVCELLARQAKALQHCNFLCIS